MAIDCTTCAHWSEFTSHSERQIAVDGGFVYQPETRDVRSCLMGYWIGRDNETGPYVVAQCVDFEYMPRQGELV